MTSHTPSDIKVKRPCSCEQTEAQHRNFCIFLLRGAISHKTFLEKSCNSTLLTAYAAACEALIIDLKGTHNVKT